jgi:pimeloyl-ACP methyl ester carboxylesterase
VADQLFALEALGIQRFSIIAVSGGTPHALALREQARDRVIKTALVSGLWNPTDPAILATMNRANRTFLQMGYRYPALTRLAVGCIATTWRFAPALAAIWFAIWLPKADRAIIRRREVAVVMAANLQQALCSGVSGVCQEFSRIAARHAVPSAAAQGSLQIWHGGDDDYVPISMGQALARHTSAPFVLVPNAGHFMVIDIIDQIFDWLTE